MLSPRAAKWAFYYGATGTSEKRLETQPHMGRRQDGSSVLKQVLGVLCLLCCRMEHSLLLLEAEGFVEASSAEQVCV